MLGRLDLDDFSPEAAGERSLDGGGARGRAARAYLESLSPAGRARPGVGLYHASPRDPVWEYVLSPEVALASLLETDEDRSCSSGTATSRSASAPSSVALDLAPEGTEIDLATERWLLNPGSVGQPRDGDPARRLAPARPRRSGARVFRRVPYPVETTQAEIRERGLPEALAARLEHGL